MKKIILIVITILAGASANAQNIQVHYDFGADRQMVTSTIEMFKTDTYGSTFFFVDFDYGGHLADVNGVSLSYLEIARDLRFWEAPVSLHAEYNSGMFRTSNFAASINSAYLLGGSYTLASADYSKVLTFMILYKYITEKHNDAFQVTTVWGLHSGNGKFSFTGFVDFWKEDNIVFDENNTASAAEYVFLSEPQLWYHLNDKLSIGGEVEISTNFAGNKGFMINPTTALKWTF